MIKGIHLGETQEVVSKFDTGDPKTIWKIGVIDAITISEIRDKIVTSEIEQATMFKMPSRTTMNVNMANVEYVRHGLKGFQNFCDSQGSPIKFKTERRYTGGRETDVLAEDILLIIPPAVIEELASHIKDKNRFSQEESKNFDSQLRP